MAEPGEDVDDGDLCDDESEPFREARETVRDLKYPFICFTGNGGDAIIVVRRRKETESGKGGWGWDGWIGRRERKIEKLSNRYIWALCQLVLEYDDTHSGAAHPTAKLEPIEPATFLRVNYA